MKKFVVLGVLCALAVALCGAVQAGERGDGRRGGRRGGRRFLERMLEDAPDDLKVIIQKRIDGQDITEEENQKLRNYGRERFAGMRERMMENAPEDVKAIMEKARDERTEDERNRMRNFFREQAGGMGRRREGRGDRERPRRARGSVFPRVEANARDAALLGIAKIKHDAGDHEATVDLLNAIIAESPQPNVQAAARLARARIYRTNLLLNDKAAEDFIAVRGPLGNTAILELMQMYEQAGEPEQGIQVLKAAAEAAAEKVDKVYFLGHVAEANRRAGRIEDALATLNQIVETISYDEAMEFEDEAGAE